MARCPFHNERTPSFTVSPDKGLFYCFGCKEGGNVFTFLMRIESLSFPESVKWVAEKLGRPLPPGFDSAADKEAPYKRSFEACRAAAGVYRKFLLDSPDAEPARRFLSERLVDPFFANAFEVGAVPEGWDYLWSELQSQGFTKAELVQAGLGIEHEGGRYVDFFRGRIMFPIHDARGRVVAFGGRTLTGEEPKYLNSSDLPIFHKGSILYGLPQARDSIRAKKKIVVVEGYMDVLACMGVGVQNAVAPLGTALTEEHARRIARLAGEVVLFFDSDHAGEEATWRSVDVLRPLDLTIRVAKIIGAKDPDELHRRRGPRAVVQAVQEAISWFGFLLEKVSQRNNLNDVEGRSVAVREAVRFLARETDPVRLDGYLEMAVDHFRVQRDVLHEAVLQERKKTEQTAKLRGRYSDIQREGPKMSKVLGAEEFLIRLAFESDMFRDRFRTEITPDLFSDIHLRKAAEWVVDGKDPAGIISGADPDTQKALSQLLLSEEAIADPERTFLDCVDTLKSSARMREERSIMNELANAERNKDRGKVEELVRTLQELKK